MRDRIYRTEWQSVLNSCDISAIRMRKSRPSKKKSKSDLKEDNEPPAQEPVQDTFEPEI